MSLEFLAQTFSIVTTSRIFGISQNYEKTNWPHQLDHTERPHQTTTPNNHTIVTTPNHHTKWTHQMTTSKDRTKRPHQMTIPNDHIKGPLQTTTPNDHTKSTRPTPSICPSLDSRLDNYRDGWETVVINSHMINLSARMIVFNTDELTSK